jgi:hypothetical protein
MRRMARIETPQSGTLSSLAKSLDTPQTARLLERRELDPPKVDLAAF